MLETCSALLLNYGASKTVCGKEWFSQYVNTSAKRTSNKHNTVKEVTCTGLETKKVKGTKSTKIPVLLSNNYVAIQTDIIENDITLFPSKSSLKKAEKTLDFQNDIANAFREKIPLITTSSGHYIKGETNHYKTKLLSNITSHFNSYR